MPRYAYELASAFSAFYRDCKVLTDDADLTAARLALVSATRAGPAWFGKLERYGAVAPGKAADLVLLDRNPLTDIEAIRAIRTVVVRGKVYDRAALDAMLADAKARVAKWNVAASP